MQELALDRLDRSADRELTRQAEQAAQRQEFEVLLNGCGPLAFRVARGVLRNSADAEDVAQEALLRAYRRFDRLRDRGQFRAWLVRISFRLALDRLKSARRRELRETRWAAEPSPARTAEELAAWSEFRERLDRALEELPAKLRIVLLLAGMQGESLDDVASLLEIPVGTVKSRLFQARKQLAEKLRCLVSSTTSK
jgi:RNA polymerase sigma-70 factor (ECF subfamily)